VSALAGLAVPGFLAAAVLAVLSPRFGVAARIAAAVSALFLLPLVDVSGAWPFLALAVGAAALASPLPCLLAAAGATLVALGPESPTGPLAASCLGLAAALAGGAVSSSVRGRAGKGGDPSTVAAVGGAALVAFLLSQNGGGLLRWTFALGGGTERLDLRGAGLLLGLALLAGLAGTLLLVARLLAPAVTGSRLLGLRLLLPAAALAALAAGHVVLQGARQRPEALAAGASTIALLVLLTGALAATLLCSLRSPAADAAADAIDWEPRAVRETALATALVWLGAAISGIEGSRIEGTYLTPTTLAVVAYGLLGLAALAPTRFPGARRLLLLVFLTGAVLLPQTV